MMRPFPGLLLLGLALAVAPASAPRADDDCRGGGITAEQAIEIARTAGLVRLEKVDCDDDEWEVEGWDAGGREIEVEIHRRSGRVREVERD
jgi:hypothetical protein